MYLFLHLLKTTNHQYFFLPIEVSQNSHHYLLLKLHLKFHFHLIHEPNFEAVKSKSKLGFEANPEKKLPEDACHYLH